MVWTLAKLFTVPAPFSTASRDLQCGDVFHMQSSCVEAQSMDSSGGNVRGSCGLVAQRSAG